MQDIIQDALPVMESEEPNSVENSGLTLNFKLKIGKVYDEKLKTAVAVTKKYPKRFTDDWLESRIRVLQDEFVRDMRIKYMPKTEKGIAIFIFTQAIKSIKQKEISFVDAESAFIQHTLKYEESPGLLKEDIKRSLQK